MIKPNNDIARVRRRIRDLTGVYPALFTVRPDDENFLGKTSYSYAEVLCGSIDVRAKSPAPQKNTSLC